MFDVTCVSGHVPAEMSRLPEALPTHLTSEWFVTGVYPHVVLQQIISEENLATLLTYKHLILLCYNEILLIKINIHVYTLLKFKRLIHTQQLLKVV